MIIDVPAILPTCANQLVLAIDSETGEVWVDSAHLPPDCMRKAGLTTIAMLRRKNSLYLPADWLINEWNGPREFIQSLKARCTMELKKVKSLNDELQSKYEALKEEWERIYVEANKPEPTVEHGPCDEHSCGREESSVCFSLSDGTCGYM